MFLLPVKSGPGRALSRVCVQTTTFELNDFDLGIWHAVLSWLCLDRLKAKMIDRR